MNEFQRRIGVGERQHVYGRVAGGSEVVRVVGDDGPNRGTVVGTQTKHWDGRVDAKITGGTLQVNPNVRLPKETAR